MSRTPRPAAIADPAGPWRARLRRAAPLLAALAVAAAWAGPLARPAPAQSAAPLAGDHWAYELVRSLDAAGAVSGWTAEIWPVPRSTLAETLLAVPDSAATARVAAAWLARLGRDYGGPAPASASPTSALPWLRTRVGAGYREGDGFLDPGGGAYGTVEALLQPAPGLTVWGSYDSGSRDRVDGLTAGGVALRAGAVGIAAARSWARAPGPASTSGALSGSVPIDGVYISSTRRAEPPLLGAITGPLAWQFSFARWNPVGEQDLGWIMIAGFEGEPLDGFRWGINRVAAFGGDNTGPVTFGRIVNMVFMRNVEPVLWDDNKFEYFLRYRWRMFGQPVAVHLVASQEDSPPWRDPGVLGGVRVPVALSGGLLDLRYDYNAYGRRGRWCFVCNYHRGRRPDGEFQGEWYVHGRNGFYQRDGIPLGDPLGGYGVGHTVTAAFWSADGRWHTSTALFMRLREPGNVLAGRWSGWRRGVTGTVSWEVRPGFELHASGLFADGPDFAAETGVDIGARAGFSW